MHSHAEGDSFYQALLEAMPEIVAVSSAIRQIPWEVADTEHDRFVRFRAREQHVARGRLDTLPTTAVFVPGVPECPIDALCPFGVRQAQLLVVQQPLLGSGDGCDRCGVTGAMSNCRCALRCRPQCITAGTAASVQMQLHQREFVISTIRSSLK